MGQDPFEAGVFDLFDQGAQTLDQRQSSRLQGRKLTGEQRKVLD
jgi:hypothetical protein